MEILVHLQFFERVMPLCNSPLHRYIYYTALWQTMVFSPQGFVSFALLVSCKVCKKQGH